MTPAEEMARVVQLPRFPDDGDRYHGAGCGTLIAAIVALAAFALAVLLP